VIGMGSQRAGVKRHGQGKVRPGPVRGVRGGGDRPGLGVPGRGWAGLWRWFIGRSVGRHLHSPRLRGWRGAS
jgi:hypothetical protein